MFRQRLRVAVIVPCACFVAMGLGVGCGSTTKPAPAPVQDEKTAPVADRAGAGFEGKVAWAHQYGGLGDEEFLEVAFTPKGGVVGNVRWQGDTAFLDKPHAWRKHGQVLMHWDQEGQVLWSRHFEGEWGWLDIRSLAVTDGRILAAANALGKVLFRDGYIDTVKGRQIAVAEFSSDGELKAAKTFSGNRLASAVADFGPSQGYVVARTDYGPGVDVFAGDFDAAVERVDGSGSVLWERKLVGSLPVDVMALAATPQGDTTTVVHFEEDLRIDDKTISAGAAIGVASFAEDGSVKWLKAVCEGTMRAPAVSIASGPNGEVALLVVNGEKDASLRVLDASGQELWVQKLRPLVIEEKALPLPVAIGDDGVVVSAVPSGEVDAGPCAFDAECARSLVLKRTKDGEVAWRGTLRASGELSVAKLYGSGAGLLVVGTFSGSLYMDDGAVLDDEAKGKQLFVLGLR